MPRSEVLPRRLGTPFVESLTSITRRLAEWDARTIAILLEVCVSSPLRAMGRAVPRFIAGSLGEAVNGSTTLTATIVAGLGLAFDLPHLRHTTLLATVGELYSRRDFRQTRAWCPACLAADGYDQLVWSFLGVTVCVRHGVRLVTYPRCGHQHRAWARGASPTHCPVCGHDLADAEVTAAAVDALTAAHVQVITWLQSGRTISRGSLAAGLSALFAAHDTTPAELSHRTGLSIQTLGSLQRGRAAPQLSSLTAILARTPYRLEDLLSHGATEPTTTRRYAPPRTARHHLGELERILRSEALLPRDRRRSLAAIGAETGVGARYASRHFPELVKAWSDPATRRRGRRKIA